MQIRFIKATCLLTSLSFQPVSHAQQKILDLNSTNPAVSWKVQSEDVAGQDATSFFNPKFDSQDWVSGKVPGTVFTSYVDAGLEKDPNFGDNIYQVDQVKYERDFWYRASFDSPKASLGRIWLNFEGINRKGDVFFNGTKLGVLDGFMNRGHYDVTSLMRKSEKNVLAVLVHWPGLPIPNVASPTYISSAGWDWMPHVPGVLSGITDDVYLTTSGDVTMVDPWVRTALPALNRAEVSLSLGITNHVDAPKSATLSGVITPGGITFSKQIQIEGNKSVEISLDKNEFRQLVLNNPKLWWPNGYGDPNLYSCQLKLTVEGKLSDSKTIKFGIKKYSYDTDTGVFHLHINGKPIFMKGGNWGMSEYLLRARGSEYDLKAKLHKDMNFNMIRNWIGSTTDEEFYDACDKYGLMVWDDFWLNSHPNLPNDLQAFNKNAVEKIVRLRNHPSIAVWCGDNEGTPLPPVNDWLRDDVKIYDGGDRWYQPNSNTGALSGSGPWANFDPAWYFTKYPENFSRRPSWGMRTEIGSAVFTNFESFKKFMPQDKWWPRNEMWNNHFFGDKAGNAGPDHYVESINRSYGEATGIKDFCRKAQLLNIETNKAMFEGWQHNMWNDASGVLTWMSQSAYPSFVWQTYDYYYDLTGAYWGAKKACEPVHIQWNSGDNSVKVINTSSADLKNVRAEATVYDIDGKIVPSMGVSKVLKSVSSNTATAAFDINFNQDNLAYKALTVASSEEGEGKAAGAATDGGAGSRWSSTYSDDQWIYVDLGAPKTFTKVNLVWESAYGKAYKIQVSDDEVSWRDAYSTEEGQGGTDEIDLPPTTARYVRMLGIKRGSQWGYSLYEFEVYLKRSTALSDVHFVTLKLTDSKGHLLSDNFYWRSLKSGDYTQLNSLPAPSLKVETKTKKSNGQITITSKISNPKSSAVAFAVRVTPVNARTGEQILPVMMNENYFSLMKGQTKQIEITFDQSLLGKDDFKLKVEPYNR